MKGLCIEASGYIVIKLELLDSEPKCLSLMELIWKVTF